MIDACFADQVPLENKRVVLVSRSAMQKGRSNGFRAQIALKLTKLKKPSLPAMIRIAKKHRC